ncbi:hypothetical protein EYR36_009639 [Pleurotus pulmonarius]|nr:hypothetical protein EYR36_009639 [Pleurotus pulmonarius]
MQEAEEIDTCRICSGPAEPGQPLFHPCKCSGTIRYIHQDCLTTWLAHSKKKSCDVCKHPYSFTKVYSTDMPSKLPVTLVIRRLLQQTIWGILFIIRAIVVGTIWLAILPLMTIWTWRMYFSMGDYTAWWISDRHRPSSDRFIPNSLYQTVPAPVNITFPPLTLQFSSHPMWLTLSSDIFTGQIIASIIVLTFVAVFLLREWISQNARPGVFEDEELPDGDQRQVEAIQALEALRAAEIQNGIDRDGRRILPHWQFAVNEENPPNDEFEAPPRIPQQKRVRRIKRPLPAGDGEDPAGERGLVIESEIERLRRKAFNRRLQAARVYGARRKAQVGGTLPLVERELDRRDLVRDPMPPFEFTFRVPGDEELRRPASAPQTIQSTPVLDHDAIEALFRQAEGGPSSSSAAPPLPFSLSAVSLPPPPSYSPPSYPGPPLDDDETMDATTQLPRRPPLPTVTLPSIDFSTQSLSTSPSGGRGAAPPLVSPSLATYCAPEEFNSEAGPSSLASYFTVPKQGALGLNTGEGDNADSTAAQDGSSGPSSLSSRLNGATPTVPMDDTEVMSISADDSEEDPDDVPEDLAMDRMTPSQLREARDKYFALARAGGNPAAGDGGQLDSDDPTSSGGEEEVRIPTPPPPPREHVFGGVLVIGADDTDEDGEEDEQSEDDDDEEHGLNGEPAPAVARVRIVQPAADGGVDVVFNPQAEPVRLPQEGAHLFEIGQAPAEIAQLVENEPPADNQNEMGNQVDEPAIPDAAAAALLAGNEDLDGNGEDDMEGALEAIGMRGPIYGVVQNAVVMIFVLHLTIGLGVWVPFTVGKSAALLVLDPYRCLQILHLPIKAMRVVTDPVVDSTIFLVTHAILPTILRIARRQVQTCYTCIMFFVRHLVGATIADKFTHAIHSASDRLPSLMDFVEQPFSHLSPSTKATFPVQPSPKPTSVLCQAVTPLINSLGPVEPYFAAIGREVRVNFMQIKASWERLALGSGPAERAFAVALGYSIVAFILAIYLHILTVGSVKSAHRAVRSTVRQQLLVLKVAAFIIIELVAFPLGCGIVLDLCTVWLFPTTSLVARVTYFFQAPLTAIFYHWVAGTVFMYSFAILLSSCRNIMRPGAMWFIKDPQDQNSHPIRDILDRPALTQLRKISVSGLMYSFVVVCVVSSVAGLLVLGRRSIMPFRLRTREPLSSVPIDLIFLHLVLPYTMHYFRPRKTLKALTTSLWRALARRLRLSSYFFGGRYVAEEYTIKNPLAYFVEPQDIMNHAAPWVGGLRRVPATDHIALPRDMRATAAVNEAGEPIDDFNKELIATQNAEAVRANRSVKDDYTVVYLPPGFRYRLFAFIAILWTFGSLCLGVGVAFPIALGRGFFHLFVPYELHDGYSLIIGFYLLWGCYLFGRAIDKLDKRRQRRGDEGPRADLRVLILKRGLLWVLKITYLVVFLGFVIPTLVSIVMDLYLILPVRLLVDPSLSPTIRIVDAWALGLLYTKIALFTQRIGPDAPINQGLRRIMNHGWTNPDPVTATKEVIGPTMLGLSGMVALPAMLFLIASTYVPSLQLGTKATFIYVYPVIFALVAVSAAVSLIKPVVPTPGPASRTSSTQAVPHTAKPKATQSGLPNSSALEHANGSEKQAKKAKSPAHKGKKKKKRDRSVLTYLRNILLTLTTIYAILACPDSPLYTSDSSPFHIPSHPSTTQRNLPITPFPATIFPPPHPLICKTLLTTHNKLVLPLQTYVIAPLYSQASQAVYHVAHSPAFAPYTTSASSFYETKLAPVYSDYLSPFWRQYIVPQYHRYVAPVLADRVLPFINNSITPTWKYRIVPTYQRYYAKLVLPYWRKYVSRPLTPYVASLQSAYERHLAPIVSRLERVSWNIYKVLVKAWKNAEPHVGRAIKGLGRLFSTIYARLEPHLRIFLKKASSQSSEALKWVWAQRRIYVDPHVKKIWVKVKELSGSDVKFDAPANGNGSRVDRDRSSALKSDSKAETVTSALSVAQESHAFVSRIPTSSTNSAEDRPPTSASSIEPTGEPSATSALEDNDSLTVLNTDIPKSIPESEASIQAEYEAVVPEVLSDAAAIKAASVIEESLFAHSSSPSLQEPTVEAVLTPSPSSPSDVYPTPSSIPPELPLDPDGFMDLDEFLANLGLDQDLPVDSPASADPPSSADAVESTPSASAVSQPAPKKTNPADMDEEERREYMDAKRLDITSRHSRWESEVESLIEAKTTEVTQKVLKLREDGVHTVLEKDSAVQVRAEDMVKEGERLLKGIGSWVAAHKDAPYAQKSEVNADLQKEKDRDMDLFDKLVGKVQEKFRDKVGEIEDEVRVWYMGVRDAEIQEVSLSQSSISNFISATTPLRIWKERDPSSGGNRAQCSLHQDRYQYRHHVQLSDHSLGTWDSRRSLPQLIPNSTAS